MPKRPSRRKSSSQGPLTRSLRAGQSRTKQPPPTSSQDPWPAPQQFGATHPQQQVTDDFVFEFNGSDGSDGRHRQQQPRQQAATTCPFTVIIDTREQTPWLFQNHKASKTDGGGLVQVNTKLKALNPGDYSIQGFETVIAVERKNIDDFISCCTHDRRRFLSQIARLSQLRHSMVIVESSIAAIASGQYGSSALPRAIVRSVLSWQIQYPNVQWQFAPSRWIAEQLAFRWFEAFWRHGND